MGDFSVARFAIARRRGHAEVEGAEVPFAIALSHLITVDVLMKSFVRWVFLWPSPVYLQLMTFWGQFHGIDLRHGISYFVPIFLLFSLDRNNKPVLYSLGLLYYLKLTTYHYNHH